MRGILLATAIALVQSAIAGATPQKAPEYQTLPSLREQAKIVDGWTEERKALIPGILRKYGVDAWLVGRDPLIHSVPDPVFQS